ncbi:MAG: hypothetical protein WC268_05155, partial [Patescibacteria group bacterium]
MSKLDEVFKRLQETKKEQKDIKTLYRDALAGSKSYQDTVDELSRLKEKKKKIEEDIKSAYRSELSKLDALKLDIQTDKEMLSDLAITQLMKGETVKITD